MRLGLYLVGLKHNCYKRSVIADGGLGRRGRLDVWLYSLEILHSEKYLQFHRV